MDKPRVGRPKGGVKAGGRKKGTPNKATADFKLALNKLLDSAAPHMVMWLERVAVDDPAKALDLVGKFAEYIYPKISRTEHVGEDGGAIKSDVTVTFVETRKFSDTE